jgi:hypothetical protein
VSTPTEGTYRAGSSHGVFLIHKITCTHHAVLQRSVRTRQPSVFITAAPHKLALPQHTP